VFGAHSLSLASDVGPLSLTHHGVDETSLYCLLFVAGGFAKVPSRPMELATWDQDMTFYLQQSFELYALMLTIAMTTSTTMTMTMSVSDEISSLCVCACVRSPLGATRSTLTLSIFYESCCEDNKWAQIVANIGHLPHNKTEEACFNVEEGVNNSKITASFSLELRFVSADAAKNATPTNAVRLKASGDFTKRDKGDLERLHADGKVSSSKKKAKKKASGFGQIFHKKRNRSRAFGQQFPPDEPVVPEIITSTVEWLRQSASKTHGLFRESASTADMDMLRKQWESGTSSFIRSFVHSFIRAVHHIICRQGRELGRSTKPTRCGWLVDDMASPTTRASHYL